MTARHQRATRRSRTAAAFGLVEVVIATLIVGVMLVAAMNVFGAFVRGQQRLANQSRGWLLAQELASEILATQYEEPDATPTFGRETGESTLSRTAYDDVDDYDGWECAPPENRDGTSIGELAQWRRTATVDWVSLSDPSVAVANEQGLKRIEIAVYFQDELVAQLTALRAKAWQEPPFN
jgi:type II secretory pathway pseudopilin PulG